MSFPLPCPPPAFPAQNSIPPAYLFVGYGGLAGWLNQNPTYKQYFWNTGYFPLLIPPNLVTSTLVSSSYNYENVPLCSDVSQLSEYQSLKYNQQLALFHKVYSYNSNAYVNSCTNSTTPIYYTFRDYQELNTYRSAAQLANKLAPFDVMSKASTLNWVAPFPVLF
jgi:hypothetical protein